MIATITAWAVLGATKKGEAPRLDKAVIYPADTNEEWLHRTFPGRVLRVTIAEAPDVTRREE